MKTIFAMASALVSMAFPSVASADNKLLIAGDSWSSFLCVQNSFTRVFEKYNDPKAFNHPGCYLTTRIGMRAEKWLSSGQHRKTLSILEKDRQVKALFLSLGGNDLMNSVNKEMSTQEQSQVFVKILEDIRSAVQIYRAARPDLKILVSGYDYPRFTPDHSISAYRQAFEEMGEPNPGELNRILLDFSRAMSALNALPNTAYIHHLGMMHFHDGNPDAGLPPGQTPHPDLISSPRNPSLHGGWLDAPAFRRSMLRITNKLIDAFHLSRDGYDRLAEHSYRLYLSDWLR